jgi:hypothetical protein
MAISVHTRLSRKYMQAPTVVVDPYTEDRGGYLYLVSQDQYRTAILCDAIVDIDLA